MQSNLHCNIWPQWRADSSDHGKWKMALKLKIKLSGFDSVLFISRVRSYSYFSLEIMGIKKWRRASPCLFGLFFWSHLHPKHPLCGQLGLCAQLVLAAWALLLLSPLSSSGVSGTFLHTPSSTRTISWLQVCLLLPVKHHWQYLWVSEGPRCSFCFGKQFLLLKLRYFCLEWRMAIRARNSVTFCRNSQAWMKQIAELVPFSSVPSWVILDRPYFQSLPILPDLTVWAEMLCSEYLLHTKSSEPIWDKNISGDFMHKTREKYIPLPTFRKLFHEQWDWGNVVSLQHTGWAGNSTALQLPSFPPWPPEQSTKHTMAVLSHLLRTDCTWQNLAFSHHFQNTHMHLNSPLSHDISKNLQDLYCIGALSSQN